MRYTVYHRTKRHGALIVWAQTNDGTRLITIKVPSGTPDPQRAFTAAVSAIHAYMSHPNASYQPHTQEN